MSLCPACEQAPLVKVYDWRHPSPLRCTNPDCAEWFHPQNCGIAERDCACGLDTPDAA